MAKKWIGMGVLFLSLALIVGCSKKEEEGGGGGTGTGSGDIYVQGGVMRIFEGDSTLESAYVFVLTPDSAGQPVTDANVSINGVTLNYEPMIYQGYIGQIAYQSSHDYTLQVEATEGHASATVTSPPLDSVKITSPAPNDHFEKGQDLQINWQYFGSPPGGVFVIVEVEDATIDSTLLDGSNTSYTVPGSKLNQDGFGEITLFAVNYVYISGIASGSAFGAGVGTIVPFSVGDTSGGGGGGYTITVIPGANPTFNWEPAENVSSLSVFEISPESPLWAIAGTFGPPVTYGTVPQGAIQIQPPTGNPPALQSGHTYTVAVTGPSGYGYAIFVQQ